MRFCISLDTRADRRTLFSETIGRQLDNEVHFHVVEKTATPSAVATSPISNWPVMRWTMASIES